MIQNREFKALCDSVQAEFPHLSKTLVMEIIKDSILFAQNHISEGSLTPIYYQGLGKFRVGKGKREWLKKKKNDIKQQL